MKGCLAVLSCLILSALHPATARQEDFVEKVHAAWLSEQRGNLAEAERILLAVRKDVADVGPDDSRKGLILYRLGSVYHSEGRYLEAEMHYRNAIQVWKRVPGTDDVLLTQSMRSLAALYLETGQYTKVERLGLDSLARRLETTMPGSATLAGLTGTLGALAFAQRKYDEAETYYRQALALWEKLAPDSRERLQILTDLGTLHYQRARYLETLRCYERALTVAEALVPRDSPD